MTSLTSPCKLKQFAKFYSSKLSAKTRESRLDFIVFTFGIWLNIVLVLVKVL